MPSPRKRIGYLPAVEIQKIIDNICSEKGLSQSKVTGILVEEALKRRGLYEPKITKKEIVDNLTKVIFSDELIHKDLSSQNLQDNEDITNKDILNNKQSNEGIYTETEFDILKDYIEFKKFKFMMKRLNNEKAG